jgi:hypothetical protein
MSKAPVWACPAVIVLSIVAAGLARWLPLGDPARALVEGWFLLICPGIAVVPLLRVHDWLIEWSLVVVVSVAIDALLPTLLLIAGLWSPNWTLLGLMSVSLVGAGVQVVRATQLRRRATTLAPSTGRTSTTSLPRGVS